MEREIFPPFFPIRQEKNLFLPSPPDDIKDLVFALKKIVRFNNPIYPKGIFLDNDYEHSARCVDYLRLPLIKGIRDGKSKRMLWIHDIPELITGDVLAMFKGLDGSANNNDDDGMDELVAAKKLLKSSDFELFKEFYASENFLKSGGNSKINISAEGLVANIIDKIDGNMYFHFYLTKWLVAGNDINLFKNFDALAYSFRQKEVFFRSLSKVENYYPSAVNVCRYLLNFQINYIKSLWDTGYLEKTIQKSEMS
jgi:5'-deoxynucleotidase YfbR-like HD superfamily hydrolase